jgi:hypothetical protein
MNTLKRVKIKNPHQKLIRILKYIFFGFYSKHTLKFMQYDFHIEKHLVN